MKEDCTRKIDPDLVSGVMCETEATPHKSMMRFDVDEKIIQTSFKKARGHSYRQRKSQLITDKTLGLAKGKMFKKLDKPHFP